MDIKSETVVKSPVHTNKSINNAFVRLEVILVVLQIQEGDIAVR